MQIRLKTRVEVDGATFWFGAADAELLRASEALQVATPIILAEALGDDWEKIGEMPEEEIAKKAAEIDIGERHLTSEVKQAFCALFVAAVVAWEGVTDDDGKPLPHSDAANRDFPTDQKVKVVCEFFNERRRLLGEESAPGKQATP